LINDGGLQWAAVAAMPKNTLFEYVKTTNVPEQKEQQRSTSLDENRLCSLTVKSVLTAAHSSSSSLTYLNQGLRLKI